MSLYHAVCVSVYSRASGALFSTWSVQSNLLHCLPRMHFGSPQEAGYHMCHLYRVAQNKQTIRSFNRVYENLHKITTSTLVVHRQMRRQKKDVRLYILQ